MAKSIKQQVDELVAKIGKQVIAKVVNRESMDIIGNDIVKQIQLRTRAGKGVGKSGNAVKLDELSKAYRKKRTKYKGKLSSFTTPGRSNATATGQMLEAIKHEPQFGKVTVKIDGNRTKELVGEPKLSNKEVASNYEKTSKNRTFFKLAKFEINGLKRDLEERIKILIKRINKG